MDPLTQAKQNVQQQIYKYQRGEPLDPVNQEFIESYLRQRRSKQEKSNNRRKAIQNYENREKPGCFYRMIRGVKTLLCLKGGKTRSKRAQRKRSTRKRR